MRLATIKELVAQLAYLLGFVLLAGLILYLASGGNL
jgi:hypothetical protein